MPRAPIRNEHLHEAFRWSKGEKIAARTLAIAALGMAVPALIGLAIGQLELGFTIGLGAMLLSGEASALPASTGAAAAQDRPSPASALPPAALAVGAATLFAGAPWSDVVMILLAGIAAAISGYSRPVAVAAVRFIIYFVLSFTLLENAGEHRAWAALAFGLGALWNVAIRMMLARRRAASLADPPERIPTAAQRRTRWRRTMRTLEGWQFPIRIVAGLAVATLLRHLWPTHHYGWIVLTVALLIQRPIEHLPVKTTQRAVGTLLGVAATWVILIWSPPPVALAVLICGLAAAAALARPRSYLAYSVVSTPVILLVFDFGKRTETALLADRLVATIAAAAIVLSANIVLDRLIARPRTT